MEKLKNIYYISQLQDILQEKNNILYIVGNFSIFNGKIAKNKVFNQAYNFTYNKATKSELKKHIENGYNITLQKVVDSNLIATMNINNI